MKWYWFVPLILIFLAAIIWNIPTGKSSETLPVVVTASDIGEIGVQMTDEPQKSFNFGATFPGSIVQKSMNLARGSNPPAKIHIKVDGPIQDWIEIDKNDFILDEAEQVQVMISIPDETDKGTYHGNITIDYINTYGLETRYAISGFLS